jgi:hypothetical protein
LLVLAPVVVVVVVGLKWAQLPTLDYGYGLLGRSAAGYFFASLNPPEFPGL